MKPYDVYFGPYLPDLGGVPSPEIVGYLVDALNVRSTPKGYSCAPVFADVASATAIGGSAISSAVGVSYTMPTSVNFFVVTNNGAVFESRAEGTDTWLNVSPASGTPDVFGDFFRYNNDVVYVCENRAPIKKGMGGAHADLFTSLGGSPPTATCAAVVRQHVVLGRYAGGLSSIRTSAIGNHEDYPTPGSADARSKEAIEEALNPAFGEVRRILGGEKIGIIIQDQALTRMTYVGGRPVYAFDTYEGIDGYGYGGFYSRPVTDGVLWYWYNETGVFATDGYTVKNISEGKIDEALYLNTIGHPMGAQIQTAYTSVFDARRKLVLFSGNTYTGATTYQLVYNVVDGSFSIKQETNRTAYFSGYRSSGTRELSGRHVYNVNGSNRKLQRLSEVGSATIALQTGYIELDPGYRVELEGAHMLGTDAADLTISYKAVESIAECDTAASGFTAMTAAPRGQIKTARGSGRYVAFRITGTGSESQLLRGLRALYRRSSAL